MSTDPTDDLARRLFDAARSERVPERGVQRVIDQVRREWSTPPKSASIRWHLVALAAAALVAPFLWLRHAIRAVDIRAESPSLSLSRGSNPPAAASAVPESEPLPAAAHSAVELVAHPAPIASTASLSDELAALQQVKLALSNDDPKTALAALDRYDHVLKGRQMRGEAAVLRMEALSRAGQSRAAAALAESFIAHNPTSTLVDRARTFIPFGSDAGVRR